MEWADSEALVVLRYLVPGFIVAWVYYALTADYRESQFERVVQALIFSLFVQAVVFALKWAALSAGRVYSLGDWSSDAELVASILASVLLGVLFAQLANSDALFKWLRDAKITKQTSHPTEWFGVLAENPAYLILHLYDGRRIAGWPSEWPNKAEAGHFSLTVPSWISEENDYVHLSETEMILVPAKDVQLVEFLRDPSAKKESDDDSQTASERASASSQKSRSRKKGRTQPSS